MPTGDLPVVFFGRETSGTRSELSKEEVQHRYELWGARYAVPCCMLYSRPALRTEELRQLAAAVTADLLVHARCQGRNFAAAAFTSGGVCGSIGAERLTGAAVDMERWQRD